MKSSSTSPCSVLFAFTFSLLLSSPSCPSLMWSFIFTYHTPLILPLPNLPFLTRVFLQDTNVGFFSFIIPSTYSHLQFYVSFIHLSVLLCALLCFFLLWSTFFLISFSWLSLISLFRELCISYCFFHFRIFYFSFSKK